MKIRLLYFAGLREQLGVANEEMELLEGVVSVAALRGHLMARDAKWQAALSPSRLRVAVNQDMAQATTVLQPGDEVAFFPPVTGG